MTTNTTLYFLHAPPKCNSSMTYRGSWYSCTQFDKPRLIDEEIDEYLEMIGAILIEEPKWCGKTTTAKQHTNSIISLQDPDYLSSYLQLAEIKPSKLLEGEKPRLIDNGRSHQYCGMLKEHHNNTLI